AEGMVIEPCAMVLSPDGRRLAAAAFDTGMRAGGTRQKPQKAGQKPAAPPGPAAKDRPGPVLAFQGQIKVWNIAKAHQERILDAVRSGEGRTRAWAGGLRLGVAGEVRVWDVTVGPEARTARGPEGHFSLCEGLNPVARRYVVFQGALGVRPAPEMLECSVRSL